MKSINTLLFASLVCAVVVQLAAPTPAAAISADLAKKCRQMAFKAYPPQRAGTKSKSGEEMRKYYRACLDNGGSPPPDTPEKPAAPKAQ